jgi:hypothetical protein
LIKQWSPHI